MTENTQEQEDVRALFKKLLVQPKESFPKVGLKLNTPDTHGVYLIYDQAETVVHVGRTVRGKLGLTQRLRNHLQGNSSFTVSYLKKDGSKLRQGYMFRYLEVPNPRLRAILEAYATGCLCPVHIGVGQLIINEEISAQSTLAESAG
jgi:hypothetical protein